MLLGLLVSVFGNTIIGLSQFLQKYALVQLESESAAGLPPSHSIVAPSKYLGIGNKTSLDTPLPISDTGTGMIEKGHLKVRSRFKSKLWCAGFLLNYVGELCGNWVALSLNSAALVTPIGVVSVLVNAYLAHMFLKEPFSWYQKLGFGFHIIGVLCILIAAPKGGQDAISISTSILYRDSIWILYFVVVTILAILLYLVEVQKVSSMLVFVGISAFFGGIIVVASKALAIITKNSIISQTTSSANHSNADHRIFLIILFVICVILQEIYKQKAIRLFPISQYQSLAFASFNIISVLLGVVVFDELPERNLMHFALYFTIGIIFICMGSFWLIQRKNVMRKDRRGTRGKQA